MHNNDVTELRVRLTAMEESVRSGLRHARTYRQRIERQTVNNGSTVPIALTMEQQTLLQRIASFLGMRNSRSSA